VILAKERMAVSEKGYKNGIGVMTAKERTAWEVKHAEFEDYDVMPKRGSAIYKWQRNQLDRYEARIKKGIAANEDSTVWSDRRTKLDDCIAKKKSTQKTALTK